MAFSLVLVGGRLRSQECKSTEVFTRVCESQSTLLQDSVCMGHLHVYISRLLLAHGCWVSPLLLCWLERCLLYDGLSFFLFFWKNSVLHYLLIPLLFIFSPPITLLACMPACLPACTMCLSTVGWLSLCLSRGTDGVWLVRVQVRQWAMLWVCRARPFWQPACLPCPTTLPRLRLKALPSPLRPPALQAWHCCDCLA